MKQLFLFLFFTFTLNSQTSFGQMKDGIYTFSNDEILLQLMISENGWVISFALTLIDDNEEYEDESYVGNGEYRIANGYGWYEFQTEYCTYGFDIPSSVLTLDVSCGEGEQGIYILTEELKDWNGTYNNSTGGVLIISNFIKGIGFDYQLTTGPGKGSCAGLDFAGKAELIDTYQAVIIDEAGSFEISFKTILFGPPEVMTGSDCTKYFDGEFTRK